jgi:hypothetical protein
LPQNGETALHHCLLRNGPNDDELSRNRARIIRVLGLAGADVNERGQVRKRRGHA